MKLNKILYNLKTNFKESIFLTLYLKQLMNRNLSAIMRMLGQSARAGNDDDEEN
jgi:hypothetical protein